MRLPLAVVAEERVEPTRDRIRLAARPAKPPLPEATRGVPGLLEDSRERDRAGRHRSLAFGFHLAVAANRRMARMLARHQHAPTRPADGIAGPMPCEPGAAGEEPVDVGCLDILRTQCGDITAPEIVAEKKDDVGWTRRVGMGGAGQQHRRQHDANDEEPVPRLSCHTRHLLLI